MTCAAYTPYFQPYFQKAATLRMAVQAADYQGFNESNLPNLIIKMHELEVTYSERATPLKTRTSPLSTTPLSTIEKQGLAAMDHDFSAISGIIGALREAEKTLQGKELSQLPSQSSSASTSTTSTSGLSTSNPSASSSSKVVPIKLSNVVVTEEASLEGWGDWLMELEWLIIDFFGTIRNSLSVYTVIAGVAAAAWVLVTVPIMAIVGGVLCMHSAVRDTIPGAWKEWQKAIKLGVEAGEKNITEGEIVASISLANQAMFATIGATLTASGIVGMLTPTVGHILHFIPVLSTGAAHVAETAITGLFGGTCILRGGIMVGRGIYNLSYLAPFHMDFIDALSSEMNASKKIEAGLARLEKEWGKGREIDIERFKRRVGAEATAKMQEYMKDPSEFDPAKKIELLEAIDRGVIVQKAKQVLIIFIGLLMIAGSIACIASGAGVVGVGVLLAISLSFALMESGWLVFDWTKLFNKMANAVYDFSGRPDYLPKLEAIEEEAATSAEENFA